ncbi:MAG: glutathione S-transferase family protein [Novosphingobium sp.]
MTDIEVTAFSWVPPMPRGLVRDLRVRWALEEIGLPYATRLFDRRTSGPEDRMPEQPFGQVPAFRDGDVKLFESGAICLWLAQRSHALLPPDDAGRARAMSWTFAALNSVEPNILMVQYATLFDPDKPGAAEFAPTLEGRLDDRLQQLSDALGEADWLDGVFSVADLLMVSVLRQISRGKRLAKFASLADYVARGEARPAFQRALVSHMGDFIDDEQGA